jgi:hypothetical protein
LRGVARSVLDITLMIFALRATVDRLKGIPNLRLILLTQIPFQGTYLPTGKKNNTCRAGETASR